MDSMGSMAQEAFREPPTPLAEDVCPTPFPVNALPAWMADMVRDLSVATQTNMAIGGTVALGALAAAVGGCAVVRARPDWTEPLNIFVAPAAEPGIRKSAVFRAIFSPLEAAETNLIKKTEPARWEARVQLEVAEAAAEKMKKAAAVAAGREHEHSALSEAHTAYAHAQSIKVPPEPRLLADDATPEAITSLLAEHGGRIAVVSAEGGLLDTLAGGRYSKQPNIDPLLKGHAGDRIRVDRKGRSSELVEHPALTLCLTLQPYMLQKMSAVGEFVGRGLLARFLFVVPPDNLGYRDDDPPALPERVAVTYAAKMQALAETCHDWEQPRTLILSPEAACLHRQAVRELEPRLRRSGDLFSLRDWAAKRMGAITRLVGLLHLAAHGAERAPELPISAQTMAAALELGDFFTEHAKVAFASMGRDELLAAAQDVLKLVRARWESAKDEEKPAVWSVQKLHQELPHGAGSKFTKAEHVVQALGVLEDHGYAVRLPDPERKPGRRGRPPSPRYLFRTP
jgi:Protein of unknown function (DUF3987)